MLHGLQIFSCQIHSFQFYFKSKSINGMLPKQQQRNKKKTIKRKWSKPMQLKETTSAFANAYIKPKPALEAPCQEQQTNKYSILINNLKWKSTHHPAPYILNYINLDSTPLLRAPPRHIRRVLGTNEGAPQVALLSRCAHARVLVMSQEGAGWRQALREEQPLIPKLQPDIIHPHKLQQSTYWWSNIHEQRRTNQSTIGKIQKEETQQAHIS